MSKKLFISLVISILLFNSQVSNAQNLINFSSVENRVVKMDSFPPMINYLAIPTDNNVKKTVFSISPNAAFCNVAFFCRQELKLEKAIKVPLRFRLGSLDQANYYEGKR